MIAIPETRPLTPNFGAQIVGLDLRETLHKNVVVELRSLLRERGLLLFRKQDITAQQQIAFLSVFGNVLDEARDGSRHVFISSESNSFAQQGRLLFHMDNHFTPEPLQALSLYGQVIAGHCSPTLFADNIGVVDRLPPALVARLANRHAVNISYYVFGQGGDRPARSIEGGHPDAPRAIHPIFGRHPETGKTHLFVSELNTHHIVDTEVSESDALLHELYVHLYEPANIYEHTWGQGDLILWDNRGVQHARGAEQKVSANPGTSHRTLCRVVIGTKDFSDQYRLPPGIRGRQS